jgi:hypothetical protein
VDISPSYWCREDVGPSFLPPSIQRPICSVPIHHIWLDDVHSPFLTHHDFCARIPMSSSSCILVRNVWASGRKSMSQSGCIALHVLGNYCNDRRGGLHTSHEASMASKYSNPTEASSHVSDGSGRAVCVEVIPLRLPLLIICRTCVASAFRVYYLSVLVRSSDRNCEFTSILLFVLLLTYDLDDGFEYSYWTSIELFVSIITTCLPPCKPLFMRLCCAGRIRADHFTDELGSQSYVNSQSYARTRSTTVPSLRFSNEDDRSTPTSSRDQYHEFHFHKTRSLSPVRMEDR